MNLLEKEIKDTGFLLALIPQKKPFVMIDKLLYFSEKKIVSGFNITSENIFVNASHFSAPGLIENMAQTVALHTGYAFYLKQQPAPTGYIGAIKKAEVFELPSVDQDLVTTVEILYDIMGVTLVESKIECKGKVIARSEMKTVLAK